MADFFFVITVPTAAEAGRPVRGVQLPRVREAPDEGRLQGEQERGGPAAGAGADPEGPERPAGLEGRS